MAASGHFEFSYNSYHWKLFMEFKVWYIKMCYFAPPKYFSVVFFKKKSKLPPPLAGTIYKKWSNIIENSRFLHILIILHTFTILDIHKATFSIEHDSIFSKLMSKSRSDTIYDLPGESNTQIFIRNDPKYWYYANIFTNWTI